MTPAIDQDFVVERLSSYEMVVPEKALAPRSLQVRAYKEIYDFKEMYELLQKAASYADDFLIYTRATAQQPSLSAWEFIPYTRDSYAWTQQIAVLWAVTWGSSTQSAEQRREVKQYYSMSPPQLSSSRNVPEADAFCKKEVLDRQRVISGKTVEVLFNYAPLGEEHFLIVPKEHRADFRELTQEEFVEALEWADKVVDHYTQQGLTCYLFHKTGAQAGQTVSHWHLHIVVVKPEYDLREKLHLAWRMLAGARPLPAADLAQHIQVLQQDLERLK